MIKNGRPYTNENGWEDGGLITDHGDEVKKAVDGWIGKNIRTAKKILRGRTSYGMKHILEHDTGIYLTNNEFKDAMLLAGYSPVNPGDMLRDFGFPKTASHRAISSYLWQTGACTGAVDAFEELWRAYAGEEH